MGVDVGGPAKGFDVAVVHDLAVVSLSRGCSREAVVEAAMSCGASVIGVDSPAGCASPGEKSRPGERELARTVCPIFFTPEEKVVRSGHPFYRWMVEGLELYSLLAQELPDATVVEVFPSAAWTVWAGARDGRPKSRWSRVALERVGVSGVPARCSQDARDAVGAALVAGLFLDGRTEDFGGIAVPAAGSVALAT